MPVIHDRTKEARPPSFTRGRAVRERLWSKVTGICLHQSASGHLHADHRLLLNVPSHAMVHRDGSITLLHAPTSVTMHGHGLNAQTIGIEIDCRMPGVDDDPATFKREDYASFHRSKKEKAAGLDPDDLIVPVNDDQIFAACWLIDHYSVEVMEWGGKITTIWAHRQSHWSRASDPGEVIWRSVALPMLGALPELVDVSHLTVGTGKPVPKEWQ